LPVGSINPIVAFAAMAASTALPPRSRICTPARAASGWLAATIPNVVATMERPTTGPFGRAALDGCSSCAAPGTSPSEETRMMTPRRRMSMRTSSAPDSSPKTKKPGSAGLPRSKFQVPSSGSRFAVLR
jgi:hypothetical protein